MSRQSFLLPYHSGRSAAWITALVVTILLVPTTNAASGCANVTLYEDFSSLAGWTVINGGDGSTHGGGKLPTWTLSNPGRRQPPGLSAPFALVDSFYNGFGLMDEELISPQLDASGMICLALVFSHDFKQYRGGLEERAEVRVRSGATGGAWVTVRTYTGGDATGMEIVDLTAFAAANLQVELRYSNANWEEYWAVDDVAVLGHTAEIFADGFEAGSVSAWSVTTSGQ